MMVGHLSKHFDYQLFSYEGPRRCIPIVVIDRLRFGESPPKNIFSTAVNALFTLLFFRKSYC